MTEDRKVTPFFRIAVTSKGTVAPPDWGGRMPTQTSAADILAQAVADRKTLREDFLNANAAASPSTVNPGGSARRFRRLFGFLCLLSSIGAGVWLLVR